MISTTIRNKKNNSFTVDYGDGQLKARICIQNQGEEPVYFFLNKNECAALGSFFSKCEDFMRDEEIDRLNDNDIGFDEDNDLTV